MKSCIGVVIWLVGGVCLAQGTADGGLRRNAAYPEAEVTAVWRGLAAGYVRKALKDQKLDKDPALNIRVDTVMNTIGAAAAEIDPRFARASWKAILIQDFGRGAAAFPGEIILVDASFVRRLQLNDDELALILAHEVAHVIAGHASEKLSFMAKVLGKEKLPTARTALLEFLAKDSYAAVYQPTARLQEREADSLGAAIFFASGFDTQRGLGVFDKLAARETRAEGSPADSHDSAGARRRAVAAVFAELEGVLALGGAR